MFICDFVATLKRYENRQTEVVLYLCVCVYCACVYYKVQRFTVRWCVYRIYTCTYVYSLLHICRSVSFPLNVDELCVCVVLLSFRVLETLLVHFIHKHRFPLTSLKWCFRSQTLPRKEICFLLHLSRTGSVFKTVRSYFWFIKRQAAI